MALKRRNRVEATFAMSSMTDLVFLLLLFFVMASTMSSPNDIKIKLPQSTTSTPPTKPVVAEVSIYADGTYYLDGEDAPLSYDELTARLRQIQQLDTTMYVRVRADQKAEIRNMVRVLDIANQHKMNIVIATEKAK
jgi:biopolymer transport protein ExbD